MITDWETRRDIVAFGTKIYRNGMAAATDGNISMRMYTDRIMITPAGTSLGFLNANDLVYMDIDGNRLEYNCIPSSELPMHLEIYRQRSEINAIIHAHPPYATAFTLANITLSEPILPEVVVMMGEIPTANYATPSTEESAEAIRPLIKNHDVILLDHHGAVACGKTLGEAYFKMEKLEHAAKTILAAKSLGDITPLNEEELSKLMALKNRSNYG